MSACRDRFLARVDASMLGQLLGGSTKTKKKGWKSLVGLRGKKGKHAKDLAGQLAALQRQADETPISSSPENLRSPPHSYEEGVMSGGEEVQSEDTIGSAEEPAAKHKKGTSTSAGKKSSRSRGADPTPVEEVEITEELKEIASRLGPMLALELMNVNTALAGSPLPTWLTRLHNLEYFVNQLHTIAQRIIEKSVEQLTATRDQSSLDVLKALEKAGGRRAPTDNKSTQPDENIKQRASQWAKQLQDVVDECKIVIHRSSLEVCRLTSLRIAYHDFCGDLYEDLYNPDFQKGMSFSAVVSSLPQTALKFCEAAPKEISPHLQTMVIHELAKAWALCITELGYAGHQFTNEDLAVIERDVDAFRYLAVQNNISEEIALGLGAGGDPRGPGLLGRFRGGSVHSSAPGTEMDEDSEDGSPKKQAGAKVNLFDYLNDFVTFLSESPVLLAQLGGNYSPEKKKITPIAGMGASEAKSEILAPEKDE